MCMFFIQCSMQLLCCFHVSDTNQDENGSPLIERIPSHRTFCVLQARIHLGKNPYFFHIKTKPRLCKRKMEFISLSQWMHRALRQPVHSYSPGAVSDASRG